MKLRHNIYGVGGGKITVIKAHSVFTLSVNDLNTNIKTDLQNIYLHNDSKRSNNMLCKKDILEFHKKINQLKVKSQ